MAGAHVAGVVRATGIGKLFVDVSTRMTNTNVLVLLGSLRADSQNRRVAEYLAANAPEGVEVTIAEDLSAIPFYNEEIDAGDIDKNAARLREQVAAADRVLAVTPEYNGTMPAVLNNAIDWLSRPYGVGAITGKPFAVIGVTPTPFGGKWAHADAARSARIAGAKVVEDATVSQTSIDVDVVNDPEVTARLLGALEALVAESVEDSAA